MWKGHLVRPTLGPPFNIRPSGTSPATLRLATSARLHWLRKWRTSATKQLVSIHNEARQEAPLQPIPAIQQEAFFFEGESIIQVPPSCLSYLRGAGRSAKLQLDANMVCGVKRVTARLRKYATANDCQFASPHCHAAIVLSHHLVTCRAAFELLALSARDWCY